MNREFSPQQYEGRALAACCEGSRPKRSEGSYRECEPSLLASIRELRGEQ